MRSANLICKHRATLSKWADVLEVHFPRVHRECSEELARLEGLPEGNVNTITVENDDGHLFLLERPTILREYDEERRRVLMQVVDEPASFIAIDYTSDRVLRQVLGVVVEIVGGGNAFVEDDAGRLAAVEAILEETRL